VAPRHLCRRPSSAPRERKGYGKSPALAAALLEGRVLGKILVTDYRLYPGVFTTGVAAANTKTLSGLGAARILLVIEGGSVISTGANGRKREKGRGPGQSYFVPTPFRHGA